MAFGFAAKSVRELGHFVEAAAEILYVESVSRPSSRPVQSYGMI